METDLDHATALALLEWQIELGADEAIGDAPVDRYALAAKPAPEKVAPTAPPPSVSADPVAEAKAMAEGAADLGSLKAALGMNERCALR